MAETHQRRVILDVDVGTDDYLFLLIFFGFEKIADTKIEAIICSNGNTSVENVCANVVRLLETIGRTDVPVYRGASAQLIPPQRPIRPFHGSDGFGDLIYDSKPDLSVIKSDPGAVALRNLVIKYPNEISVVCVAPLTNVALAIKLYDDFVNCVKDVWIMGGNYTAVGNVTATAEFNFYVDPEAAFIVLNSIKKPIFLLTWETCLHPKITFEWRYNIFGSKENLAIQMLNKAEKNVYREDEKIWLPCDAFLAAAFLYPDSIIRKQSFHNASVELHGFETRGQIVLDHLKTKRENVTIIEEINEEMFKDLLLKL